ncbi:MAG: hypothetical protein AB7Q16_24140 [Vicinamibacterales bacterium]
MSRPDVQDRLRRRADDLEVSWRVVQAYRTFLNVDLETPEGVETAKRLQRTGRRQLSNRLKE